MTEKSLIKYMVLFFVSAITACSGGGSPSEKQEKAPSVQNLQGNTTPGNTQGKPAVDNTGSDTTAINTDKATNNKSTDTDTTIGKNEKDKDSSVAAVNNNAGTVADGSVVNKDKDKIEAEAVVATTSSAPPEVSSTAGVTSAASSAADVTSVASSTAGVAPATSAGVAPAASGIPADTSGVSSSAVSSSAVSSSADASVTPVVASVTSATSSPVDATASADIAPADVAVVAAATTPKIMFSTASGGGLSSAEGRLNQPASLAGVSGKVIYTIGTDRFREKATDTSLDNKKLSDFHYDDSVFSNNDDIDPTKVQLLEVNDDAGNTVGTFQFVKQNYSEYITFMPKVPRAQSDESVEYFSGLYSYIATPTSDSDFSSLTGEATYTGKVIGYDYPLNVGDKIKSNYGSYELLPSHPKLAKTPADISLTVNFDTKKITGQVTNRFDHLAGRSYKWTDDYDNVTQAGLDLDKKPLLLEATILKSGEVWGFQGPVGGSEGVSVETKTGAKANVAGWGGIFAGENAKEVVGIISAKEVMTFGATKN